MILGLRAAVGVATEPRMRNKVGIERGRRRRKERERETEGLPSPNLQTHWEGAMHSDHSPNPPNPCDPEKHAPFRIRSPALRALG